MKKMISLVEDDRDEGWSIQVIEEKYFFDSTVLKSLIYSPKICKKIVKEIYTYHIYAKKQMIFLIHTI